MKMKKQLLPLTAAFACTFLLSAMTAGADPSISSTGQSYGDSVWVDGTGLLEVYDEDGSHLGNLSGDRLSETGFSSFFYSNGCIIATRQNDESINSEGLYSADGRLLIECRYGSIDMKSGRWAIACSYVPSDETDYDYEKWFSSSDTDRYYQIDSVDIYYIANGAATLTATLTRDDFADAYAWGEYLSVEKRSGGSAALYDSSWNIVEDGLSSVYAVPQASVGPYEIFTENGLQGIADTQGNILAAPSYPYIYEIRHGLALVSDGTHEGLIDLSGNVIIPLQVDHVLSNLYSPALETEEDSSEPYASGSYVAVETAGKLGYYDLNGNLTVPVSYPMEDLEYNGASCIITNPDGSRHLLAADGGDTALDEAHSNLSALYYGNGYLYVFRTDDYKAGLMDWHGNELLPPQYEGLTLSGDGHYLLAETDYTTSALYTVTYDEQRISDAEGLILDDGTSVADASAINITETEAPDTTQEVVISYVTDDSQSIPVEDGGLLEEDSIVVESSDAGISGGDDLSTVATLLSAALELVDQGMDENRDSIISLLDSASQIADGIDLQLSLVIDGASSLLDSGAATVDSLSSIINTALAAIS